MRASLSIFLISLLISQSLCANTNAKAQDINFLESIRRTDFGKTLLQSLQLTAKTHSKDAVQSVVAILNQMLEDETDAQADADAAWEQESSDCDAQASDLNGEIEDAQNQIDQNTVNINILNSGISGSQASLDEANDKLVTSTNALQNLVDARAAEHATFLQNVADISATITALQQGKDLISTLLDGSDEDDESASASSASSDESSSDSDSDSGSSSDSDSDSDSESESDEEVDGTSGFFQKKAKKTAFAQFTSHVKSANLKKSTKYHGFVTALLAMLSKDDIVADQGLVTQVLHLIENLVEQLSAELTTLAATENDAQNIFETQQTYLNSDISNLNSQIADLQSDITDKSAQVADLTADNANLQVNLENKSQELADSQQTCSDDKAAYDSTSETRLFTLFFILSKG